MAVCRFIRLCGKWYILLIHNLVIYTLKVLKAGLKVC
jgi:hypothetical protein